MMEQIDKDAKYYRSSKGGVTFSGGEASLHFELLKKLLTACREKGYHTALETNGLISAAHLKELIPLTDLFLFDFKHSDPDALKKWASAPLAPILESLAALEDAHAHVWLRCPVIPGVNDTDAHFVRRFVRSSINIPVLKRPRSWHTMTSAKRNGTRWGYRIRSPR